MQLATGAPAVLVQSGPSACGYDLSEERHEATDPPAPAPIAVAAPTAFARVSSAGMLCLRVYPMTIAAAKLSPQPTVSATATCSQLQVSETA